MTVGIWVIHIDAIFLRGVDRERRSEEIFIWFCYAFIRVDVFIRGWFRAIKIRVLDINRGNFIDNTVVIFVYFIELCKFIDIWCVIEHAIVFVLEWLILTQVLISGALCFVFTSIFPNFQIDKLFVDVLLFGYLRIRVAEFTEILCVFCYFFNLIIQSKDY